MRTHVIVVSVCQLEVSDRLRVQVASRQPLRTSWLVYPITIIHYSYNSPHVHHMTFWCTGGCRDKLYTTPPITRWTHEMRYKYPWYSCNRRSYETSSPGINPGVHYSYIQIRMARFLAPGLSPIFYLLPFNLNHILTCCNLFYLRTSTYTHRVFVFTH